MIIQKGSTISFRIPSDLSDEMINYLNQQKQVFGRKWSSVLASRLIHTFENEIHQQEENEIILKISALSQSERLWINNSSNQEMLIKFIMQALHKVEKPDYNSVSQTNKESTKTPNFPETIGIETQDFIFSQILK